MPLFQHGCSATKDCYNYTVSKDVTGTVASGSYIYHRNGDAGYFARVMRLLQAGPEAASFPDKLVNRTSGLVLRRAPTEGRTAHFTVAVLTRQSSPTQWLEEAKAMQPKEREAHEAWWQGFWGRGHLEVEDFNISRQHLLERYLHATQARSPFPIKFNGMLFNAPKPPKVDRRNWGGLNWWQNLRMPYYSMLASGDSDFLETLFESFLATLPLAAAKTQHYYNFSGAIWDEYTHPLLTVG